MNNVYAECAVGLMRWHYLCGAVPNAAVSIYLRRLPVSTSAFAASTETRRQTPGWHLTRVVRHAAAH